MIFNFLTPILMLLLGFYFKLNNCKKIGDNGFYINRSKKSIQAWNFTQKVVPNTLIKFALLLLVFISLLIFLSKYQYWSILKLQIICFMITITFIVLMIIAIYYTIIINFDKDGQKI